MRPIKRIKSSKRSVAADFRGRFCGGKFAVSGALAQGITQNPLADSGLGINAGAGLGLALVLLSSLRQVIGGF